MQSNVKTLYKTLYEKRHTFYVTCTVYHSPCLRFLLLFCYFTCFLTPICPGETVLIKDEFGRGRCKNCSLFY